MKSDPRPRVSSLSTDVYFQWIVYTMWCLRFPALKSPVHGACQRERVQMWTYISGNYLTFILHLSCGLASVVNVVQREELKKVAVSSLKDISVEHI